MLIPREVLAACLPATTEFDTRYRLSAVQIEPSGQCVATDGAILVTAKAVTPTPDTEFPIVAGAPFHGSPDWAVQVPSDQIAKLLKVAPKKTTIPVLQCLQLSRNGSDETATLAATDLETPMIATLRKGDHTFPNYERILSNSPNDTIELVIGVDILKTLIATAKAVNGRSIRLHVPATTGREVLSRHADKTPATYGAVNGQIRYAVCPSNETEVSGVFMPMRA